MNSGLYTRLAAMNMKKNKQFYLPYLLTGVLTVAMFYIMWTLKENEGLDGLRGASNVRMILGLGTIVIGIFAVIFLFYTNSFIIKRRKKELGVYNILGMEKKHLAKVLFFETLFTAAASVGGGLVTGVLFNKLMCMLLYRMMGYDVGIDFYISDKGLVITGGLFGVIYLLTLLYNMMQIKLANPIELLHGGNVGEREPKTKILMTVVGIAAIGVGYYIAITTENPLKALTLFFVAVVLVIVGTYSLFTAGSIALLKLLRKNKKFYYKAKHFPAVSFMIYRMKQNAVGLANICILSTMVLVMVSTTVSMFFGVEDEIKNRYPNDICVNINYSRPEADFVQAVEIVEGAIAESGRKVINKRGYSLLNFMGEDVDGQIMVSRENINTNYDGLTALCVMTRETYEGMSGETAPELAENEVLLFSPEKSDRTEFVINELRYAVKDTGSWDLEENSLVASMVEQIYYVVVSDSRAMDVFYRLQKEAYEKRASEYDYQLYLDIDGSDEEKAECGNLVAERVRAWREAQEEDSGIEGAYSECRQANADEFQATYGGFLFIGLFLGGMFLMITVLIIFYKQISEGYDDRERFAIMEKVGMSSAEVKATIRSQIIIVFFLPLVTASIHVAAAFPMIRRLLNIMYLTNESLFVLCVLGTILIFAVIYLLVFLVTSKTYYRIVGNQIS